MKNASPTQSTAERARILRIQAEVFGDGGTSLGSYLTDGEDRLIIGSSKRADLVVPNEKVSQIHAMLRVAATGGVTLYDLGSESGTFVGGKKIVERELTSGEFFEIGTHRVRVNLVDLAKDYGSEHSLFWSAGATQADYLETIYVKDGTVQEERTLARGARLFFGRRRSEILLAGGTVGELFLERVGGAGQTQSVRCRLPAGYQAEIYDENNDLVRTEKDGASFTFNGKEKAKLVAETSGAEVLLFWRQYGKRTKRNARDAESPTLQRAYVACFVIAAILLAFLSYVPLKTETLEEALAPKSSYFRTTMDAAPAGPAATETPEAASSEPTATPSKAASISSNLSKLLNKQSAVSAEKIQQAISKNGQQTVRTSGVTSSNMQSQEIGAGAVGGGSINVNAVSAGLASGGGVAGGSLKGFANGKGTSIGGGGAGKGFSMNLGGDEAEAIGGLDKSLIAAVVQANIGQIKHCYERQLIVDPNIFGKVVAQWTITKDGLVSVTSVKKTTMNNAAVEKCILAKIKGWEFPKPKGGGQVMVSYPFLFKSLN